MDSPADGPAGLARVEARVRAAVESVAATDPAPMDPFRGLYVTDELAVAIARSEPAMDPEGRLRDAARRLGLDELDTLVLAACAAPELNPAYGRLFAYLHDDVTRKLPSPGLVARLVAGDGVTPGDVLARFGRDAPLRRMGALRLIDERGQTPLADRAVKIADPVAALLLGAPLDVGDERGRLRRVPVPEPDPGRPEVVRELRALTESDSGLPLLVVGPDAPVMLAAALRAPLLVVDAGDATDPDMMDGARLAAALEGRRVCVDGLADLDPVARRAALPALSRRGERVLAVGDSGDAVSAFADHTVIVVEVPMPDVAERRAAWAARTGAADVEDVAAKFRLSVTRIAEAADVARETAAAAGLPEPGPVHLDLGARRASSGRLGELAQRMDPVHDWDQLVLPDRPLETLRSISGYLRHRDLVLAEWGYGRNVARSQGLTALFAGESGTGKTMAAQVLAHDLGLDLFRVDLATVVSKYIGETEKNLDRVFSAAEGSNAILFFDEADALFGKRSEVSDAHDRYANVEVAYLLQKMEAYRGAVILATNFRQNIDEAFLRRLDVVVDFPFPEPEDRLRIWRLVLPDEAPVGDDVDLGFLATRFKLSGGGIRNASLAAAFLAADDGRVITMRHLVVGVALEYGKLGRLTLESDFERFHAAVRAPL
ncbi:ATP-binding protein [Miltoncostaea marina]|uniref:ATP-binding protein n=1 Tax=Miltoncostaea marina TaxID=2843215 RepID=UPI001C3CE39E|nr:ATP-binding protein [Miltoncostaea marina]